MNSEDKPIPTTDWSSYPLLDALKNRRSRRFGIGMSIPDGPLAFTSKMPPTPLTEDQEAALVFAACGLTGSAVADLAYAQGHGGNIMGGLVGRTIASGDGLQTVALIVTNDTGTWFIRRPRELGNREVAELIELGRRNDLLEIYRRTRVRLSHTRTVISREPIHNINANRWSAHAPGTTYFLPVNDLTLMYINGLLEILNETTGVFVVDERNGFRPAGLKQFARSKGGHLDDNPDHGKIITVRHLEQFVNDFVTAEQGMMLQNLGLMAEALKLGGYPNFANHETAWFEALGFTMASMPTSQYLGVGAVTKLAMRCLGRDRTLQYPIGLGRDGDGLLEPFSPPTFRSMSEAVEKVVELKFAHHGAFGPDSQVGAWADTAAVKAAVPRVSNTAVAATKSYCGYVWQRYGRFPVYTPPYRTLLGFQACNLDPAFYEKFYQPGTMPR